MSTSRALPFIKDAFPRLAQYLPGQEVAVDIELKNPVASGFDAEVMIEITSFGETLSRFVEPVALPSRKGSRISITVDPSAGKTGGYGVDISLVIGGDVVSTISSAYDVVEKWSDAPRYGFLTGFAAEDATDSADVEQLRKYHISAVQFYDWMYKHHDLIPPQDEFIDPMGRSLSLAAVRQKIALCHSFGMKAMAYGAVYAASPEFAAAHRGMKLWRGDGEQEIFGGGWQNIMDVSKGSPWAEHIVNEYARAVRELHFDGVHMDTYGFPKTAFAKDGDVERFVRLREELPKLIDSAKEALGLVSADACVIFNAVGGWPAEEAALSLADASYVEAWPPCDRYAQIHGLIGNLRRIGRKPVILAAYVNAFKNGPQTRAENALLLLQAAIFASGGYHIGLGEMNGVLCDPYFVKHATVPRGFARTLRNWYDFIVRYSELLYDMDLTDVSMTHAGGINEEYVFSSVAFSSYGEPGKVWTIVKERPGTKVIHLINLTGIHSDRWNEGKPKPKPVQNIAVRVLDNERASAVWLASPDRNCCRMERLPFTAAQSHRGRVIEFTVPVLEYWDMVYIETEY